MRQDLKDRLAALRVDMPDEVVGAHLNAIARELNSPQPLATPVPRRRVRVAALVATAILLAIPATAVAADGAVPGDLLYPVKRATEAVVGVFDPNVEAENRIEEAEIVIERNAPAAVVRERLSDAEEAVKDREIPPDLTDRLETIRTQVRQRDRDSQQQSEPQNRTDDGGSGDRQVDRDPVTTSTTEPPPTTVPSDSATTTTTEPSGNERNRDRGATTTTQPHTDRPPRDATTTSAPPRDGPPPRDG